MNTEEKIFEREALLQASFNNLVLQNEIKEMVSKDVIFFFNNLLWTYDPRREIKIVPFILYPFQEDFINTLDWCYIHKEHLLVEKSRDMGFSWLVLGYTLWKMITEIGFSAGVGSRKMELVDKLDSMKSLMQRIRFLLNYLPFWLRKNYQESKHSKLGLISIPDMQASISGEAGDDIGRGDRTSLYVLDEFAHIPRSASVQEAISQTTDFRIYGSTPKGRGNEFARLRWKTMIKRFTMHWKNHPLKSQEWYDKQKETMTEEQIAQEIDISYTKSMKGKVYKWFNADKHANEIIPYNPDYDISITCDWGIGDPTAVIFFQYYKNIVHIVDYFEETDTEIKEIFIKIGKRLSKMNNTLTVNRLLGIYGDPDGRNRNIITASSIADFIRLKYGKRLKYKLPDHLKPRILSVRMLGKDDRIKISKHLTLLIECMENYVYPEKEHGENEKPLHNWASHGPSALERYCVYEHGLGAKRNTSQITSTRFR